MSEINHNLNKIRISDILKKNKGIFGKNGVIDEILIGVPSGSDIEAGYSSFIIITNAAPFESIRPQGIITGNSYHSLLHTVRYKIIFVLTASDSPAAEQELDELQKLILESLESNNQFKNTAGTDPICDKSYPERIDEYKPEVYGGTEKQGRSIIINCIITTD